MHINKLIIFEADIFSTWQVSYLNGVLNLSPVGGVLLGDGDSEEEAGAGVEGAVAQEELGYNSIDNLGMSLIMLGV